MSTIKKIYRSIKIIDKITNLIIDWEINYNNHKEMKVEIIYAND